MMSFIGRLFRRRHAAAPPPAPPAPPPPETSWPSLEDLRRILGGIGAPSVDAWAAALHPHLALRGLTTPQRLGAFLANVAHESAGFTRLVENLHYSSADRIRVVWPSRFPTPGSAEPFVRNPQALANRVYADRLGNGSEASGEGWRYRGRGLIQVTGRANYAAAAAALGKGLDDVFLAWCETREGAAATACWWWSANGCNAIADRGDAVRLRERINGGLNGLADVQRRQAQLDRLLEEVG